MSVDAIDLGRRYTTEWCLVCFYAWGDGFRSRATEVRGALHLCHRCALRWDNPDAK